MKDEPTKQINKDFNIRVLDDGKFVLREGMEEYGYEDIESLLSDLKSDLEECAGNYSSNDTNDAASKKEKVKKMMEESND